jgi:hypothetical protein
MAACQEPVTGTEVAFFDRVIQIIVVDFRIVPAFLPDLAFECLLVIEVPAVAGPLEDAAAVADYRRIYLAIVMR